MQVGLFSVSPFSLDGQRTPAMLFRQPSKSIHPIAAAKSSQETVAGGGPHIGLRLCQRLRINTGPTSSISAAGPNASTSIDDLRSPRTWPSNMRPPLPSGCPSPWVKGKGKGKGKLPLCSVGKQRPELAVRRPKRVQQVLANRVQGRAQGVLESPGPGRSRGCI